MAEYLAQKGFKSISLSDILRQIMRKEGEETTTVNMTEFGNNLRETKGHGYLAKEALKKIGKGDAIVTSIRQVGEVKVFKTRPDFTLVKLDAPIEMRLERLIKRNRPGDIKNMDELRAIEVKQAEGKGGAINMNKCYEMATETIINDGTFEELYKKVDDLISKIKSQHN
jgi:dephospho-CoA kinase